MNNAVLICMSLAVWVGGALTARAQGFAIDRFSIDGGGGTSTGGVYSVSGTIGQPDAGMLSGGNYNLSGGFWSIAETLPAPRLTVKLTSASTVVVSWPSPSTGWNLQQNAHLDTMNWAAPSEAVTDDGTNKSITLNRPSGSRFFRLFKP